MKGAIKLADFQKKKPVEEQWLPDLHCCICNKRIEGYYSRHGDTGTCSSACMKVKDREPKYPGHSEAEFFMRVAARNTSNGLDHEGEFKGTPSPT